MYQGWLKGNDLSTSSQIDVDFFFVVSCDECMVNHLRPRSRFSQKATRFRYVLDSNNSSNFSIPITHKIRHKPLVELSSSSEGPLWQYLNIDIYPGSRCHHLKNGGFFG